MGELVEQGGWVLVGIMILSLSAWMMIAWKWQGLLAEKKDGFDWAKDVIEMVEAGKRDVAIELCHAHPGVLSRGLLFSMESSAADSSYEKRVIPFLHAESLDLYSSLPLIGVLAGLLPLLGLLGTVLGMVHTFSAITMYGTKDPSMLATGISQALITTQAGLVAALPIVLLHRWLYSKARRCKEVTALYAKRVYGLSVQIGS